MKRVFRIGTRGSLLALAQANEIRRRLQKKCPGFEFRLVIIKTTGDEFQSVELFKKTNVGVFTKTIEQKLLKKDIDIAVHSLKDLPTDLPKGLVLAAFPKRLDPADVVISRRGLRLADLPKGALVGTGSPRRKRQLLRLRPDLKVCDIHGNLDTRISKVLKERKYDAVVVAKAGLLRIKKYLKYAHVIPASELLPAVGQAALGIQTRKNDKEARQIVRFLNHPDTEKKVRAERSFLKTLEGGCRVPVGIHSKLSKERLFLKAAVFSTKNLDTIMGQIDGPKENFDKLGKSLAKKLLRKGASNILCVAR